MENLITKTPWVFLGPKESRFSSLSYPSYRMTAFSNLKAWAEQHIPAFFMQTATAKYQPIYLSFISSLFYSRPLLCDITCSEECHSFFFCCRVLL